MGRMILVSNRLPITLRHSRGSAPEVIRSSGGLVAGLDPLHQRTDSLWVGYPGEDPDAEARQLLAERRLVPVSLTASEVRGHYQGYSNGALWPLFHYLLEHCRFDPAEYDIYHRVNEKFAGVVLENAAPDDVIWVHDYHLMLLPGMLRKRLPHARIGFFLHTPFPSVELFRILPQRDQILEGLIGSDLIGVHTYDYAQNLVRTLRRLLGLEARDGEILVDGRRVEIETHPLGIDVDAMQRAAFSPAAERRMATLKRNFGDRQVILGVDRLDYTKGLPHKLMAFRNLLARSPRWRGKVVLVQVAVPSRTNVESYRRQKRQVDQLVGDISGAYGSPGRIPVHYIYRSIPQEELGALYRLADVAFISPIRDGLNLVAKEYVACQRDGGGVLVLSEFAGAASELGEAIRVNPWDIDSTAAALERALEMGYGERNERMMAMYRRVRSYDVHRWVNRFTRALSRASDPSASEPAVTAPELLAAQIGPAFARARSPLLLLDYDGSLREFTRRSDQASPTEEVLEVLTGTAALEGVRVFIISGRDRESLSTWLGELPLSFVAEHGAWRRYDPSGPWSKADALLDVDWKDEVRDVLATYVARTPGARIEEKSAALVWHYREADPDLGSWQARELSTLLEDMLAAHPVEVMSGADIVEVRQQGIDKGSAYAEIERALGPFDFILATGDDRTDEDLFEALPGHAFSVHVGQGPTRAKSAVSSPAALRTFLRALIRNRSDAGRAGIVMEQPTRL